MGSEHVDSKGQSSARNPSTFHLPRTSDLREHRPDYVLCVLPGSPGATEIAETQAAAARYRCEFVDLRDSAIEHDLFRSIPVDLMFRYNFVPLRLL